MESRARLFGHSIHQTLIVFPLGLLGTAVIFDALTALTENRQWTSTAFPMIGFGVASGLVAAIFGWIDYSAIPTGTRAKKVGLLHGAGNILVLLMFALSWWFRSRNAADPGNAAYLLSTTAFFLVLITGWLGGELVSRLGVGVSEGAGLNAPSSLKGTGHRA